MAQTLKGCAAIWGVAGFGIASGVVISSTTTATQSVDVTRDGDIFQIADSNGETKGEVFYNNKVTISVDVIPLNATTIATAITNAAALQPAPGTTVTIADSQCTIAASAAASAGKFSVLSSTMKRTNTGVAVISMQLRAYEANDVTVAVS